MQLNTQEIDKMAAMLARMNQENISGNQKDLSAVPPSVMSGQRGALTANPLG